MNTSYYKENDDVIVTDDKGETKTLKNLDNIDEILETENIIMSVDDRIDALNARLNSIKEPKNKIKRYSIFGGIAMSSVLFTSKSNNILETLICALVSSLGWITNAVLNYFSLRSVRNSKRGIESSINYLTKKKEEERDKLRELIKKGKIVNSPISSTYPPKITDVRIYDWNTFEEINAYARISYIVGTHLNETYKNYLNGSLDKYIPKFEDAESNVERYVRVIEEIGPQYIKKFKKSDKYLKD